MDNKKECKVCGDMSLFVKEVLAQVKGSADTDCNAPNDASCVQCEEVGHLGEASKRNAGKKESYVGGLLRPPEHYSGYF